MSEKIPPTDRGPGAPPAPGSEPPPGLPAPAPAPARSVLAEQLPVLRAVARNLVRNPSEVEDLVQDAFERALRAIDRMDLGANPRGWMVTILHNLHIDRCRQRARMQPHVSYDEVAIAIPEDREPPIWSAITGDDLRRAASRLPTDLRDVYVMFAFDERSYIEIADALGIPKATVGTRLSRARARLKQLLSDVLEERGR